MEIGSWVAAPSASAALADLGADVIKIEPVTGDPMRGMQRQPRATEAGFECDAPFINDNRGKRSIAMALNTPEGHIIAQRLIERSDVLVTNARVSQQEKLGISPSKAFAVNPKIVHATLTGYGLDGRDADLPGFDVTSFFARGAVLDAMMMDEASIPLPANGLGDHMSGLALLAAILVGLRNVDVTGQGQAVDVSLFGTAAWAMATDLTPTLVDGHPPRRRDRRHRILATANSYQCSDGRWVILNMPEAHWWPRLCVAIGRSDLVDDERFTSTKSRFDNMPELIDKLDEVFASRDFAAWSQILSSAELIWGPVANLLDLAEDAHANETGLFPLVAAGSQEIRTVAIPFRVKGSDIGPKGPAPAVGGDSREILEQLGFNEGEVSDFISAGIVTES